MNHTQERIVAAVFSEPESARASFHALESEGYGHRWMAITTVDTSEPEVARSSDGPLGAIGRFFSGAGNSLRVSLEDHGLSSAAASRVEEAVPPGGAVVVVRDERGGAASILSRAGGKLIADDDAATSGADATGAGYDVGTGTATAADAAYDTAVDSDVRRLELREERLTIDKRTVPVGEATIGKHVETQQTSVDVPVMHEELFVERRPVGGARAASGTIGDGETIHVPLSREEVVVDKTAVVREEVVVGQRRVDGVAHVDETLRREVLDVSEDTADSRSREANFVEDDGRRI